MKDDVERINQLDKLKDRIAELEDSFDRQISNSNKFSERTTNLITSLLVGVIGAALFQLAFVALSEKPKANEQHSDEVRELSKKVTRLNQKLSQLETETKTPPFQDSLSLSPIVFANGRFSQGYFMRVDSSWGGSGWIERDGKNICMNYPGGEMDDAWGAVSISVGTAAEGKGRNFSSYSKLSVDAKINNRERPKKGVEPVNKTTLVLEPRSDKLTPNIQGDRYKVEITDQWQVHDIELNAKNFPKTEFNRLYTVASFVFTGTQENRACFKDIRYS